MKGVLKPAVFMGMTAACVLAASPVWAELKIAFVNYTQLMEESPQAKVISEQMRSEFMPRQRELQNQQQTLKTRDERLQKDGATMSDEQRAREEKELRDSARDLQRKNSELQDDVNARRNEEISRLQHIVIDEVRAYAKAQSFDLVLADNGVIYANSAIDITSAVLTQLQAHAGKTGASSSPSGSAAPSKAAKPPTTSH